MKSIRIISNLSPGQMTENLGGNASNVLEGETALAHIDRRARKDARGLLGTQCMHDVYAGR